MTIPTLSDLALLTNGFNLVPDRDKSFVFHLVRNESIPVLEAAVLTQELRLEPFSLRASRLSAGLAPAYRVCAEGDSWVNILWPLSSALGYEKTFVDAIAETLSIHVNNIGWPGDEFKDIVRERQFEQPIKSNSYDFFILSGGGNDFLGGSAFRDYLKPKPAGGAPEAEDCLDIEKLDGLLAIVEAGYRDIIKAVKVWSTKTATLMHGYDYAIPQPGGRWLGGPLEAAGYNPESDLAKKIVRVVVDRFHTVLQAIDLSEPRVHLMDLRGQCRDNWHDELHPNTIASRKIAAKFLAKFQELVPLVG